MSTRASYASTIFTASSFVTTHLPWSRPFLRYCVHHRVGRAPDVVAEHEPISVQTLHQVGRSPPQAIRVVVDVGRNDRAARLKRSRSASQRRKLSTLEVQ